MFGKQNNPYEEVVVKATDEKQTEVNWDILLTVWDKVLEDGEAGARNCVAALQKRLQHRSANVQLFSLELANALVVNCGPPLHREISGKAFTQMLVRIVNDRTTHDSVKQKTLDCVEKWVKDHPNNGDFDIMVETYETLKKQNHRFTSDRPASPVIRDDDAMRREEEELQRALAESAQMASPLAGYQRSQPPASSSSTKPLPHQPPSPVEQFFAPPGGSSSGPRLVRAIYDFEGGQSNDELPFVRGDVIRVVECVYQDWWRGELRGREGIFPANRVEEYVEPPSATPAASTSRPNGYSHDRASSTTSASTNPALVEAEAEAELFAQSATIDKLLNMMRTLSARGEDLADNEELAELYNASMRIRPKVVGLIKKYDKKQAELRAMNDKFAKAAATYQQMSSGYGGPPPTQGYGGPSHQQQQQQQQPGYGRDPYGQPPHQAQQQQLPPQHDPERQRREIEERDRIEYERKMAEYEIELANWNAQQAQYLAAQQQQQQFPPQGQPLEDPSRQQQHPGYPTQQVPPGPNGLQDPQAQYYAHHQQQPSLPSDPRAHPDQAQHAGSPPPNLGGGPPPQSWAAPVSAASPPPQQQQQQQAPQPVWDGQQWVYPAPPPSSIAPPAAAVQSPHLAAQQPPQQAQQYPPSQGNLYPAPSTSPIPLSSGSPPPAQQQQQAPTNLIAQMGGLSLDQQQQQQPQQRAPSPGAPSHLINGGRASPSIARHQLYDPPLASSAQAQVAPPPQQQQQQQQAAVDPQQQQQGEAEAWAKYRADLEEYNRRVAELEAQGVVVPPPQ